MAQASPALPAGISLRGSARRQRRETIVRGLFLAASLITILISLFIIVTVLFEAISFLSQIDLGQLFGIGWFPRRGIFDVSTIVIGTLIVTAIAMVIATPVGHPLGDLPLRVRHADVPADRQADPRGPRRHSQRRPGVLRPDAAHADA